MIRLPASAADGTPQAVSCTSAGYCVMVGTYDSPTLGGLVMAAVMPYCSRS